MLPLCLWLYTLSVFMEHLANYQIVSEGFVGGNPIATGMKRSSIQPWATFEIETWLLNFKETLKIQEPLPEVPIENIRIK